MQTDYRRIASEGLIAGIIGYAAIVLFFAALDLVGGRSPFYTAAVLGSTFVGTGPEAFRVEPRAVLAYNGLHIIVFVILGMISARIALGVERVPRAFFGAFYLGVFGFILVTAMVYAFAVRTAPVSFWAIVVGMALAVGGMLIWLLAMHPVLRREIAHMDEIEETEANGLPTG